ncbi:MAG: Nramp family divalent metal transporter [bacterium]|nr:Nramp family divalent metal transporter [bacterium]
MRFRFSLLLPGILVAATGVGAGDLLTASLAGSEIGLALLWAALAGALLKWTLNEGVARWQMATGTTLLEGWISHLGNWIQWVFLAYLILWSFSVGGALITACGIAGAGLFPLGDPTTSKIIWGVLHSLVGLALVWMGGFRVFEILMAVCISIMFVTVLLTALLLGPEWGMLAKGLFIPSIPPGGLAWTLGILGGVGGTVTLMCYGYWIREAGRESREGMRICRIDLTVGYTLTALFGIAMVIIGSRVALAGRGASVALLLAGQLELALGPAGRWAFLLGFWGAVFSSLLGVWQGIPYLFADFLSLRRGNPPKSLKKIDLTKTGAYRAYLVGIAVVPLILLWYSVKQVQLTYAILGALFMPLLAFTLLILNNRVAWVGKEFRNTWWVNLILILTLLFFGYTGGEQILSTLQPLLGG